MCGIIPVTVLDTVFRQAKGSRIPANAKKIQDNVTSLDYGEDFRFLPAADAKEAADKVAELYQDYVEKYGQDYAQVLTPYRKRGDAGVDAMNERLRELVNPKVNGAPEIKTGRNSFRVGDRIIHNKNKNTISNGDIGYVREIFKDEDGLDMARLEFSEGRTVEYNSEDLGMVEHAYATTVHKSQGSECPVVILPWLSSFYMMLRRNILYTAITRAKEAVIIVGEKRAVIMANWIRETLRLERELHDGTYKERPPKFFTVTEPKTREIMSIAFRDRVYQRSLNDKAIYPMTTRSFIYDNHACQKGKGTDKARRRLVCFLQKYYRKHGAEGYVLQCDIKGYYPNKL